MNESSLAHAGAKVGGGGRRISWMICASVLALLCGAMGRSGMADGPHPGMTRFEASSNGLEGPLKNYFVPFKFYYPNHWESFTDASGPGAVDYVRVRSVDGDVPLNEMAVGYFTGNFDDDKTCSDLVNAFANSDHDLGREVQKVGEGRSHFGKYPAYEICLQGTQESREHGSVVLWMRGVIVRDKPGSGVFVLLLASALNDEIKQASDLGQTGELKKVADSFQFLD